MKNAALKKFKEPLKHSSPFTPKIKTDMRTKNLTKHLCIFTVIFFSIMESSAQTASSAFKVVAYQKYNTIQQFNPKTYAYYDQLIYKLISPNSDGALILLPSSISDLNLLKKGKLGHDNVKLLIGIGGAKKNSQHFSVMAANPASRKKFITNIIEFCHQHGLDGADIDWEYPKSNKDKTHAVALFQELHHAFTQNELLLTAAVTYTPDQVRFAKRIENYVDQINLMVYEPAEGLYTFQEQIDFAIALIYKEKLNLKKLVVGLPFYGKNRSNGKAIAYNKIINSKKTGSVNPPSLDYMDIYETANNVQKMKSLGLSGIMFWELGFDTDIDSSSSLLKAIYTSLK